MHLREERDSLTEQLNAVKKEQEDILILLTEQSDKISEFKRRLRNLGETVSMVI